MSTERFDMAANVICPQLSKALHRIPDEVKFKAQEIRIRLNRPVAVCTADKIYYITRTGGISNSLNIAELLTASSRDISDSFQNICNYSVYSRQNEIKNGFITVGGGHRAGISGTAIYSGGEIVNIRDISSINLRVSREIKDCSGMIFSSLKGDFSDGFLICGAPSSGKTTLLRDIARTLSSRHRKKVAVIDERGELAGTSGGIFQNDLGQSDILDGYKKGDGIMHAVRCLSPDIVICDEMGAKTDISAVNEGLNTGVAVIASIHASSFSELMLREQGAALIKTGAFKKVFVLAGREHPGELKEVINEEELLACLD